MVSVDIEKLFKAKPLSTWGFLSEDGQGCYIPAYQRPYSWDKDNVSRLFEDAIHGIHQLLERDTTISFLGTIIAIHDTKHRTVHPIYKPEVAPRVMTVIDGQQRACTLVMANLIIHDYLCQAFERLSSKSKPEEEFVWLLDQCQQMIPQLEKTYLIERPGGQGNYKYYPRVIRAFDDAWSRRPVEAKYTSPIARLIWEYINYSNDPEVKKFQYKPLDESGKPLDSHATVVEIFSFMQKEISNLIGKKAQDYDFQDVINIANNPKFIEALWGYELPDAVRAYISEKSDHSFYKQFCETFRLVVFAKYLNERMAFTIVETESEDDAFDMFEALNTTGEPLTAFETFKPKVIEQERLEQFEHSPSYKLLRKIEEYLEAFKKAEQKQSATSELLIPFALAETGDRLQKRLNEQRRYLRDKYDALGALEQKRDFVTSMANLSQFMQYAWGVEKKQRPSFKFFEPDDEVLLSFDALRQLNHQITIAPLSRFYDAACRANDDDRQQKISDFIQAVRATTAFSMLWRAAKGGTDNIDSHYREIMRNGIPSEEIPPLSKNTKGKKGVISLINYKRALRYYLNKYGELTQKENWVKAAARTPIYKSSAVVARFILFCAYDNAIVDTDNPGLIKRGRRRTSPIFTFNEWIREDYSTVEHIAPQSNTDGSWDPLIYDAPEHVHKLGNLILLPQGENGVLGNRAWDHKKIFYSLLCAEDDTEFASIKDTMIGIGLTLSKSAEEIFENSHFLGICKSVTSVSDWSLGLIDDRSKCIASLAWDRLSPWLDLDTDSLVASEADLSLTV